MLIRTKLLAGFGVLLVLFIVSAYSSWTAMKQHDNSSKGIQLLDAGTAQILESNIANRRYVASQNADDAKAAHAAMEAAMGYIKQAMTYNSEPQQAQRAEKILQQITTLQGLFTRQEQEVRSMQENVALAIDASGKAFNAITEIVGNNIANLRQEALPRRIEAADLLDKVKGLFLLGRNQFTTYRLTNSETAVNECLRLLNASLEQAALLENYFRHPRQLEQMAATVQAISNYKASFEKFVSVQTRMHASQQEVRALVENIRNESQTMIDAANTALERTQARDGLLTLAMTAGAVLVSVGVGIWVILSITRPLASALRFAQEVAQGDFTSSWQHTGTDEFGTLALSLNKAFAIVADKAFWYESILHSLPFLLATMDGNKRFTFVNKNVLKMLGKTSQELIGKPCSIWGASICNTEKCAIACIRNGKSEVTFEQPGFGHMRAIAVELFDKNHRPAGFVDMVFDINEEVSLKREADEALHKAKKQTVETIEDITGNLNVSLDGLAQQVSETHQGTGESAQRITEIATAMEEMNSTVLEVARSAGSAAEVSNHARSKAELGATIVGNVVHCIADVEKQSLQLKDDMRNLGEQAEAIGAIMDVISDIADQTNLLALNAAIEAARAGEAGRGFAVVADEVRKLAEKTMQATVEVGNAIKGVQRSAEQNMKGVDTSSQVIEQATALVHQAGEALQEIVGLVETSADQVRTIATASEEQSATSEEINRALGTINANASETARAMAEATQSVFALSRQAQNLSQLIEDMKRG